MEADHNGGELILTKKPDDGSSFLDPANAAVEAEPQTGFASSDDDSDQNDSQLSAQGVELFTIHDDDSLLSNDDDTPQCKDQADF